MKVLLLALALFSSVSFASEKDWTFVVFMNADNNLCGAGSKDIEEMKSFDASEFANVIVVFDCATYGDSKILKINGKNVETLNYGLPSEFDMGDYKFFMEIVDRVLTDYPASKNFVTLWNHGSGWEKSLIVTTKGISYDDNSRNHMNTPQLGIAMEYLSQKHKIDVLGFDACLMQMIEVIYEVSDYVGFVLGSEFSEPADGWEYTTIMKTLATKPTAEVLGSKIVKSYMDSYINLPTTGPFAWNLQLSLIDTQKLKLFTENLAIKLTTLPPAPASAFSSIYWGHKDLGSFVKWTKDEELYKLYNESVVVNSDNTGFASGIAIFVTRYSNSSYSELKFEKDIGWLNYLTR